MQTSTSRARFEFLEREHREIWMGSSTDDDSEQAVIVESYGTAEPEEESETHGLKQRQFRSLAQRMQLERMEEGS